MLKVTVVAGIALVWTASSCAAADIKPLDVKPGLWETKASTEMAGMPKMQAAPPSLPPEVLAKMPPAQRAQIEAMMKTRSGGGPMITATKVCMTRESLASPTVFSRVEKSCTPRVVSSTGGKQQVHVECNQGGHKVSGDLTVERVDGEHVKGSMVMTSSDASVPLNMKMSFETRWIASDCGNVKPAVAQ